MFKSTCNIVFFTIILSLFMVLFQKDEKILEFIDTNLRKIIVIIHKYKIFNKTFIIWML